MLFLALGGLAYEPIGAYNTHEYAPWYDESGRFTVMNGAALSWLRVRSSPTSSSFFALKTETSSMEPWVSWHCMTTFQSLGSISALSATKVPEERMDLLRTMSSTVSNFSLSLKKSKANWAASYSRGTFRKRSKQCQGIANLIRRRKRDKLTRIWFAPWRIPLSRGLVLPENQ